MALSKRKRGDAPGCERSYREAIRADANDADAHYNLGCELFERNDFEGAEESYRAATRADPTAANAHHRLGCVLAKRGDDVGAEESFRDACRCDPKHAGAHTGLGLLLMARGEEEEAVENYDAAIRADPQCKPEHVAVGILLKKVRTTRGRRRGLGAWAISSISQSSRPVRHATPRLIQCFCVAASAIGSRTNMTKFVEWPVVESTPWRTDVLYTGHMYTCAVPSISPV